MLDRRGVWLMGPEVQEYGSKWREIKDNKICKWENMFLRQYEYKYSGRRIHLTQ
jgi:hypothetical protein